MRVGQPALPDQRQAYSRNSYARSDSMPESGRANFIRDLLEAALKINRNLLVTPRS